MYTIEKEFHFSASHRLEGLPEDHQCARLHGHNYILKVMLTAHSLDHIGFVMDYGELGFVKDMVDALDHRHLNDLFVFNPTSENICAYFWREVNDIVKSKGNIITVGIALSETPKTWARFERHVA